LTAADFLYGCFRKCGQMRPGYTNSPELLADGLREWLAWFDALNARRTNQFTTPDYVYPIGSNTGLNGIYGPNVQFTLGPVFTVSATLTIGSAVAVIPNTAGLIIGQYITGTGIPANTYITAIAVNTSVTLSVVATAAGAQTLTITPTFTGPRPEKILRMNLWLTATPTSPTRIPMAIIDVEEWNRINVVQFTATDVATTCYPDYQFPQMVLNIWPPLNGNSLEIFTWGFLNAPATLTASYSAPPGYQDAIEWTLATRLWGLCTNQVAVNRVDLRWLEGKAAKARQAVRDVNRSMPKLRNDFGGGRATSHTAVCDWGLLLVGSPY